MEENRIFKIKVVDDKAITLKSIPESILKIKVDNLKYIKPNFNDANAEAKDVLLGKTFYSKYSGTRQSGTLDPEDFAPIKSISKNGEKLIPDENKNVNITMNKDDVGLNNVDNTSDEEKPISLAQLEEFKKVVYKEEGKGLSSNDFTDAQKIKLEGIQEGAEKNVQSDWNENNTESDAYIKNKPQNLVQDENYIHTDNNFTNILKDNLDELIQMKENDMFGKVDDVKVNNESIILNKIANFTLTDSLSIEDRNIFASAYLTNLLNKNKVDKVEGKQLSTNDFTNEFKQKLEGLENYNDAELRNLIQTLTNDKADKTEVIFKNSGTTQNINSNISLTGDLNVVGNIIQNGSAYETHVEKVFSKNDLIITRDGAVSGLANNEFTGILAKKYDGTNDGQLVFDNNGVARVGDVGNLQPLATREEIPLNNGFAKWNSTLLRFDTTTLSSNDLSDVDLLAKKSELPTKLSQLENDTNFVDKNYVDENGGKIDSITVNNVTQEIIDKNVNITVPTALSELSEDENHKLITLEEKTKLQNLSNYLLAYRTFDVGQTYNKFELVNYYDRIIISKIDNNIGNYPTLQPTDPNWLFLSFYSEQLPIKSVSAKLFILGSSTPSTSGNEAVYKEGNCYILDGKVYDKDGVLANNQDVETLNNDVQELGNELNQTTNNLTNEISAREQADTNLQTQINDKASLSGENTFEETPTFNKDIVVKGNISDGINNVLVSEILKSNITNTFSAEQIFNDNIILKDGYGIKSRLSTGALKNIIYKDGSGSSIIIGDTSVDIITNGKSFLPMTNIDLGSTALKWRNVYLSGSLNDGTNNIPVSDIAKKSSFVLDGTTLTITL